MFTQDDLENAATIQSHMAWKAIVQEPELLRSLRHHQSLSTEQPEAHCLLQTLGLRLLVGQSPQFLAVVQHMLKMARYDATVLISGETGTGKEVCARVIHYLSRRAPKPFIAVNCGAVPAELVENELFGHERGAFTDAVGGRQGLIHEAEGGTLFLDEIDCLPLLAQVKLLRFLQEKEYRPLGGTKTKQASIRIITASNADLEAAVQQKQFRRDLYYRINILPLELPPLRERPGDIVLLVRYFLTKFADEFAKPVQDVEPEAFHLLAAYSWPGNVRELEHTIERAVALTENSTLRAADIALPIPTCSTVRESFHLAKERVIAQFEQAYITDMLLAYEGNITKAAEAAGKNRRAFWQLMRKHGIDARRLNSHLTSNLDKC